MMEPVLFPDTATLVIEALEAELAVPVYGQTPSPRPDEFVTVIRVGGVRSTLVSDGAQIAVDCWSTDDVAAHNLAQLARAAVFALYGEVTGGVQVYRVDELSGPSSLPDPTSAQPRYTFQNRIAVRGTPQTGS